MKHSEESKRKMSEIAKSKGFGKWQLGKHHSQETKEKMSKSLVGNTRRLGIKHSEESKKKMSLVKTGVVASEETLKKMSLSSPKVWLGKKFSEEHRKKIGLSNLGKQMSVESREKMRISKTGESHWRWYKDRTKLKKQEDRRSSAVDEWRKNIYKRDEYKCKFSNKDCKGRIEAHHILNWEDFPELRYNLDNGITVCHHHHPRGREKEKQLSPYLQELVLKSK